MKNAIWFILLFPLAVFASTTQPALIQPLGPPAPATQKAESPVVPPAPQSEPPQIDISILSTNKLVAMIVADHDKTVKSINDETEKRIKSIKDDTDRKVTNADNLEFAALKRASAAASTAGKTTEAAAIDQLVASLAKGHGQRLSDSGIKMKAKIFFVVKGDAILYLNGKRIGDAQNERPADISTNLSVGDVLVVRSQSPYVYRHFRIGLILEGGIHMPLTDVRAIDSLNSEDDAAIAKIDATAVNKAPNASSTAVDAGGTALWVKAGFSERDAATGMPEKNKMFTFAVIIK